MISDENKLVAKLGRKILKQIMSKFQTEKEFILACKPWISTINLEKLLKSLGIDPSKYIKKKKDPDELYKESI